MKHQSAGEEPQHHHNTKPEQYGGRHAEWELHHHWRKATSSSVGRRVRGERSDTQTRNGNLAITGLVESTRHARQLQQEMSDLGGGWGDITGESRRMEVKDAGGPIRLPEVVAVCVVPGVEQVCAGGWKGLRGREQDTYYI
jgi:hypothetical protein